MKLSHHNQNNLSVNDLETECIVPDIHNFNFNILNIES